MIDRSKDADFSVAAAIHRDGAIYLARRSDTKQMYPGCYELPAGHVQVGESFSEALSREIDEELHVSVNMGQVAAAYTFESEGVWKAEVMYMCTLKEHQEIRLNDDDHTDGGWYTKDEISSLPLVDILKEPLEQAFEMIKQKGESNE